MTDTKLDDSYCCPEFKILSKMEFYIQVDGTWFTRIYSMKRLKSFKRDENDSVPHWIREFRFCPFCGVTVKK